MTPGVKADIPGFPIHFYRIQRQVKEFGGRVVVHRGKSSRDPVVKDKGFWIIFEGRPIKEQAEIPDDPGWDRYQPTLVQLWLRKSIFSAVVMKDRDIRGFALKVGMLDL